MKLEPLTQQVELKAIRRPTVLALPKELEGKFTRDEWKIFGHFCNTNPELDRMSDPVWLKNVAKCIAATANGKLDDVIKDPLKMPSHPFTKVWQAYYQKLKDEKALLRKDPKVVEANKARSEKLKELYGKAKVEGVDEPLQSYTLEPEGIFPGRPGSPDTGLWKEATKLEDVYVNAIDYQPVLLDGDSDEPIEHEWNLSFDPENHYAAKYLVTVGVPGKKPVTKAWKKIMFGATSSVKKEGQAKKYEAGDQLMAESAGLIKKLEKELIENPSATTVAVYCLFFKGIRIGDKKPTRNGTRGLLSIRWVHEVTRIGDTIHFDFIGKDSVRDISDLECSKKIADSIEKVWKKEGQLDTTKEKIKDWVKANAKNEIAFTPKLSRTMVAARTMINALDAATEKYKLTKDSPEALKKLAFDEANMEVAHQLNHQKGVSKAAEERRKAKFEADKGKRAESERKAKELTKKRKAQIAKLKKEKKAGWQEKVAKVEAMIAKSEFRTDIAEKKAGFKETNQNFTASTSKAAYIDPKIIADWCAQIELPIEKIYNKTQMLQFNELMED